MCKKHLANVDLKTREICNPRNLLEISGTQILFLIREIALTHFFLALRVPRENRFEFFRFPERPERCVRRGRGREVLKFSGRTLSIRVARARKTSVDPL